MPPPNSTEIVPARRTAVVSHPNRKTILITGIIRLALSPSVEGPRFPGDPPPRPFHLAVSGTQPKDLRGISTQHSGHHLPLSITCECGQMPTPRLRIRLGLVPSEVARDNLISSISLFPRIGQSVPVGIEISDFLLIKLIYFGSGKIAIIKSEVIELSLPKLIIVYGSDLGDHVAVITNYQFRRHVGCRDEGAILINP